jgi:hypothetical protein
MTHSYIPDPHLVLPNNFCEYARLKNELIYYGLDDLLTKLSRPPTANGWLSVKVTDKRGARK